MTTVHVDLREMLGLPVDAFVPDASLRIAPPDRTNVDSDGGYIRVENFHHVPIVDGTAEFDAPATTLLVHEHGFTDARPRVVQIPDQSDVDYADLEDIEE